MKMSASCPKYEDSKTAGPHHVLCAEGRIEPSDGTLMCSYHGWRFKGDGACTKIPQALDSKAEEVACSSGRSCAAVHPTQVRRLILHPWLCFERTSTPCAEQLAAVGA